MAKPRHSESVLSDLRDGWWSYDYLELIGRRLKLAEYASVLDVGCGQGHWGLLVLPLFSPAAMLSGVDQETDWITRASERSRDLGVAERCEFRQADAMALPYAEDTFDLVTCQTLLMHLARPDDAIAEMLRVLRPGGRLLLAEPSNLANQFSTDTVHRALPLQDIAAVANLLVACSRGRDALGRGDDSIADVLPEMLEAHGLQDVQVFQNERPSRVSPPYGSEVKAQLDEEVGHSRRGFWLWDKGDARALFEAGGGDADRFEAVYAAFLCQSAIFEQQVASQTYARTGGGHHYLITGRRT